MSSRKTFDEVLAARVSRRGDQRGVLWIQTDSSAQNMATADWENIGNQMLAADP